MCKHCERIRKHLKKQNRKVTVRCKKGHKVSNE